MSLARGNQTARESSKPLLSHASHHHKRTRRTTIPIQRAGFAAARQAARPTTVEPSDSTSTGGAASRGFTGVCSGTIAGVFGAALAALPPDEPVIGFVEVSGRSSSARAAVTNVANI